MGMRAQEARTERARSPLCKYLVRPLSYSVAVAKKGMGSSSKLSSPKALSSLYMEPRSKSEPRKRLRDILPYGKFLISSKHSLGVYPLAKKAPMIAPPLLPEIAWGRIPSSKSGSKYPS